MSKQPAYGAAFQFALADLGPLTIISTNKSDSSGNMFQLLSLNPDRVGLNIINTGANDVWVGPDASVVGLGLGIYLPQKGGFVTLTLRDDYVLMSYPWYVLTAGLGAVNVYTIEYVRVALPSS